MKFDVPLVEGILLRRYQRFLAEVELDDGRIVTAHTANAGLEAGVAFFPDAVSVRGSKHLRELAGMVGEGRRAVLCFCVQRGDAEEVRPADLIDPIYGRCLREAIAQGVEALAYRARVSVQGIVLEKALSVFCP